MRSGIQGILILLLFVAVGYVAYTASGAGDPPDNQLPPEDPAHPRPHYPSLWSENFATATQQATAQNRLILARFTGSDWCSWCKRFHREIEDTPEFQQWAANNVILFDADFPHQTPQAQAVKEQNEALSQRYNVDAFPTLLLLKPDGTEVARLGYVRGGPQKWLAEAQPPLTRQSLAHPQPAAPAPATPQPTP